ncbi:MAG: VOC family protein [Rhodospirillaceae bacterium]|nr:VOC family protein [Rhodospirillaceae bacterium]
MARLSRRATLAAATLTPLAARAQNERRVGSPRAVTIGVANLPAALGLFRDTMGLTVEREGPVSRARLSAWGVPAGVSATMAELSCAGYPTGRVRLLALDPPATRMVRHDFGADAHDSPVAIGPKAIDFYGSGTFAQSVDTLTRHGLTPRHATPAVYPGGLEEYIFTGPGGAPTMVMARPTTPSSDLRPDLPADRFGEIATISVIAGDLDATRRFYGDALGLAQRIDRPLPPGFVAPVRILTGAPEGLDIHWMMYGTPQENSAKFLILHFSDAPKSALRHGMNPAHLGLCIYSFPVTGLTDLHARLSAGGFEIVFAPASVDGAQLLIARGPNGEFCEFMET